MRFCMVGTYYPPYHFGGDAVFVQSLARALVARGHQVEVVHCEDAYRLGAGAARPVEAEDDGITVHRLRSPFGALSSLITHQISSPGLKAPALRRIFERDFDVVNFHNISLIGGLGILAMSQAAVNVYTLHEHWLLCPTHIFWKNGKQACDKPQCIPCCLRSGIPPQLWRNHGFVRKSLQHVDALLSPSVYTARRHEEADLGRPIHVLPTYSAVRSGDDQNGAPERPRFVYVGRVTASKGVHVLAGQFATMPQYDLDIFGNGDLLDDLTRQHVACPSIRFRGPIDHPQVARCYLNATAMILPSIAPEVFPLCVLEAFACGTPVIVSDAGGNREAVDYSGAGLVYRTDAELRNAAITLAEQDQLRNSFAARARRAYEEFYCEDRYMTDYLALIDDIRARKLSRREEFQPAMP
jgi:glycosyltransferase involved in cell wall biosynthesis